MSGPLHTPHQPVGTTVAIPELSNPIAPSETLFSVGSQIQTFDRSAGCHPELKASPFDTIEHPKFGASRASQYAAIA